MRFASTQHEREHLHPMLPHLGLLVRYFAQQHQCVDNAMQRWMGGKGVVLCKTPADYVEHMTANQLRPIPNQYNWEVEARESARPEKHRDD